MYCLRRIVVVFALCAIPGLACAQGEIALSVPTAPSKNATPWAATASLGYLSTHGDRNSTSLNFEGALGRRWGLWSNVLRGQGNYARDSGTTSAQTWQLGDQLRRSLGGRNYLFGTLSYLNDRFAGVNERISEAAGYGREVLETDHQKLDLGAGAGANQQREAGSDKLVTQPMLVFYAAYRWKISDHAEFSQTVNIEAGTHNTFIDPVTQLKLTIIGNLFASLQYELRYNTNVPAGSVHTNTITTVNLGYSFGKF